MSTPPNWRRFTEVEIVDDLTVRMKTDGSFALLAEVLANYCEILPRAILDGEVDPAQEAIGNRTLSLCRLDARRQHDDGRG